MIGKAWGLFGAWLLSSAVLPTTAVLADGSPKIGPPPPWVQAAPSLPPEKPDVAGLPFVVRLQDVQVRFDVDGWTEFHEIRAKIQSPAGLQALGAIPFQWSPWSDTLTFHRAQIIRDGQTIDVLPKDGAFTVLRRETGLEQAMLTGELTTLLQPEGLQVGDVLDVQVSIRHADPLLKGRSAALIAGWDVAPVSRFRLNARWPSALNMRWKETHGLPDLQRSAANDETGVSLDLQDVRPPNPPAHAPARYNHGRQIEFTTLKSWSDVAQLMGPLYSKAADLPPGSAVASEAAKIMRATADRKERASAALRLVEGQVRYLAHAEGGGGFVPQTADETWRLKYGDCKAKTVLLLALLRALGVQAIPALANIGAGDALADHLPSATLFNHVLVRATIAGQDYWLDGTRQGDRDLDDPTPYSYGWVLPLEPGANLVRVEAAPFKRPQMVQVIRYDAAGGVTAPEPTQLETTFRGDLAVALHDQLASVPPERIDEALKTYWAGVHSAFTPSHVKASWNPDTGEEILTADGTSKLDWSGPGLELQHVGLGGAPDIKRDPAANDPDAPYAVDYPSYVETDESVVLPPGDVVLASSARAADVDAVLGGVAYHRSASLDGGVLKVVATIRAVKPEITLAEARASVEPLTRLGETSVYAPAGVQAKAANDAATLDSHPTSVDGHIDRGNLLLNKGRFQEAKAEFDAALALDPSSQSALADRAVARAWLGERGAAEDADKADKLGPPSEISAHARAILALKTGDTAAAKTAYLQALAISPGDEFALERLFTIYLDEGDLEAAKKTIDDFVREHPESAAKGHLWRSYLEIALHHPHEAAQQLALAPAATPDDRLVRARGFLALHDKDSAKAEVDAALKLQPTAAAWMTRASADGGYASAQAAADVDEALKVEPANLAAEVWRVDAAFSRGEYKTARSSVSRLTADHPEKEGDWILTRAKLESRSGMAAEASADFDRAHGLSGPTRPSTADLCTSELFANWRPQAALADCEAAQQDAPRSVQIQLSRATLLHRLGRDSEAGKLLDVAESEHQDPASQNNICYSLATENIRLERALADCDASLKVRPDDAATLDSRAFVLLRLGRDDEALAAYDKALSLNPEEANSLFGRALVEARLHRLKASQDDMTAALKIAPALPDEFKRMGVTLDVPAIAAAPSSTR